MFPRLCSHRIVRILQRTETCGLLAASIVFFALSFSVQAQELAERLFLKDGSYQLITKYEVKGDRVRYLSAERNEWEELPSSLVDWDATKKYQQSRAAGAPSPAAAQLEKDFENARNTDEATQPEVAPGLRLPDDSGVFLLDNFAGEPQLIELAQTTGDVNRKVKGNIFRGELDPIASSKVSIELEGEHASVQAHTGVPSLYIRAEGVTDDAAFGTKPDANKNANSASGKAPQSPQQPAQPTTVPSDRFRIIRTNVRSGRRTIDDVKRSVSGKPGQDLKFVKVTTNRVIGGWLKVTPTENLGTGEYALVEMNSDVSINLYLWDFGVNQKAPANKSPYLSDKPEKKDAAPAATAQKP